jgi:hypothetical protein
MSGPVPVKTALDDMKKLITGVLACFSLFAGSVVGEGTCATDQCENARKILDLPADVQSFVSRRDGCDHFRGEPTEFDQAYLERTGEQGLREQQERADFVNQNVARLCSGTDAQLRALKARYAANPTIIKLLNSYESQIEL